MKKISGVQRHLLWPWLWLPILACQFPPNTARAADRREIPLIDVGDLRLDRLP